jgi:3-oxoacyl-[acyl-carrier-protein] synthase II
MLNRVAITGMGVVTALGDTRSEFFEKLAAGASGIDRITRFDCSTFEVQLGAEVKKPVDMPEGFTYMEQEDVKITFVYKAFRDALHEAGYTVMPRNAFFCLGTSLEVFNLNKAVRNGRVDFPAIVNESIRRPGIPLQIPLDTPSRMISSLWGSPSLSLTNCSACAASLQAIGLSFQKVRSGEFDVAFCGGFDSMLNPLGVGGFQLLGALTKENELKESACRPFDASRTGTVLGEGAAVFVLEPYDKAMAEGKAVLAEICGFGSSLDAHNLSAPDPNGEGAERAMRNVLSDAGITEDAIQHINAHGTGTRLNDEVEAKAIRRVFASNWERIPVSATKSVTGHVIGAAGAVETAACLLPLMQGTLPPHPFLSKVA